MGLIFTLNGSLSIRATGISGMPAVASMLAPSSPAKPAVILSYTVLSAQVDLLVLLLCKALSSQRARVVTHPLWYDMGLAYGQVMYVLHE